MRAHVGVALDQPLHFILLELRQPVWVVTGSLARAQKGHSCSSARDIVRNTSMKGGCARRGRGKHRRRLGLKAHGRKLPFTDQQLIALYEKGMIDREIAVELDVSPDTVGTRRRKLGLKAHTKRALKF